MDGGGEGADRRREFRRWGEHIRGRAAVRSGARAVNDLATPGVEAGGQNARVRSGPGRACGLAEEDRKAAHVLSAFASGLALTLAHIDCDEKSNEIPAVQKLIAELRLPGSLLTVDAIHCQKKPSKKPPAPAST
jgi:hypothetical protein